MENNKWFYNTKFEMLDFLRAALVTAQSYVEELQSHENGAEASDDEFLEELENILTSVEDTITFVENTIETVEPMVDSEKL